MRVYVILSITEKVADERDEDGSNNGPAVPEKEEDRVGNHEQGRVAFHEQLV